MRQPALVALLESIAANVRRIRLKKGLTQEMLAERASQDLSYLQRVERGATNLSVGVLVALAGALDVTPAMLLRKATRVAPRRGRPAKKRLVSRRARSGANI